MPDAAVDGPALVWAADLVVSAGGTMNREAAVLGVADLDDVRRSSWARSTGSSSTRGGCGVLERVEDIASSVGTRDWHPPEGDRGRGGRGDASAT